MLSSGPLAEHICKEGDVHRVALFFFVGLIVFFQLVDVGFYFRTFAGDSTMGQVTHTEEIRRKRGRCVLNIRAPDGGEFDEDVAYEWCEKVEPGARVPIVHVRGRSDFSQVGKEAGVHLGALLAGLLVFLFVNYASILRPWRPWWKAKLVESGDGRLPTT